MKNSRFGNLWVALVLLVFLILLISMGFTLILTVVIVKFNLVEKRLFDTFWFLLVILLSGILTGTIITALMGNRILYPISKLREATREVAKGNFGVRLYENYKIEEFADMSRDFNKMVQELQGIETLRNDFVTNVSHEFKTPLTAIEGYATLLQDKDVEAGEREDYAGKIISSTRQLSQLTSNILKLSKLENQEILIEQAYFRLDEQIREALLLLEPEWSRKLLSLDLQLADTEYFGSEELLMQVWLNVIGNAVKFSHHGGNIAITLSEEEGNILVSVKDSGIGMDPEVRRHVFEKFYRGDKSRTRDGNGLGLPLARRIVELSHGRITVDSAPGLGCTFTIDLPRETPDQV
ncbi:sensor histidine kinase ['Paenibacillus yunnanensis' Narsing Rao et al. 2020]|uniref:sensor histidine kinase n=1 Tax=Paenibacillus tengchongensis TaxID=2608684 RepID=UPI00124E962A|nr:HAMP domain-containing sensor histidine kinase [Paenibacillus tengchongensis]